MNTYKSGDVVVYGAEGVCVVTGITEKKFDNEIISYYVLEKVGKKESTTYVPSNNERSLKKMRLVLTKEEFLALFKDNTQILPWIDKDRDRQKAFKDIILFGDTRDLVCLIKTLYSRQIEQHKVGKRLHISDERIFKDAEKIIKEEISYVFGISIDEVHDFILNSIGE